MLKRSQKKSRYRVANRRLPVSKMIRADDNTPLTFLLRNLFFPSEPVETMLQSTIAWACGTITSLHASGWPIFSDVLYRCYSRRHNTYLQNPFNQGFLFAELIVFNSMLACLDEKVLRTRKHIYFNFSSAQLSYLITKSLSKKQFCDLLALSAARSRSKKTIPVFL